MGRMFESSHVRAAVLLPLMALAPVGLAVRPAHANHLPADKIGVSASVMEVMTATASPVGPVSSGPIVLLQATLRNSSPTDLMIKVTGECALWTEIVSPSSDAKASVKIWTEMDGTPVPVTTDANGDGVNDDPDDGRVVFSNRDFQITSLLSVDILRLFIGTRSANAFNWITLNVGSGIHSIVVKAQLDVQVTGAGVAKAAVGKRTLIVEPAKLANDATVSFSDPPPADAPQLPETQGMRWGVVGPNPFDRAVELELLAGRAGPRRGHDLRRGRAAGGATLRRPGRRRRPPTALGWSRWAGPPGAPGRLPGPGADGEGDGDDSSLPDAMSEPVMQRYRTKTTGDVARTVPWSNRSQ